MHCNTSVLFKLLFIPALMIVFHTPPCAGSEFDKWKREELDGFRRFRDQRDREFAQYLKKQWEEFRIYKGEKAFDKPKPRNIPTAPEKKPSEARPFIGKVIEILPPTPSVPTEGELKKAPVIPEKKYPEERPLSEKAPALSRPEIAKKNRWKSVFTACLSRFITIRT